MATHEQCNFWIWCEQIKATTQTHTHARSYTQQNNNSAHRKTLCCEKSHEIYLKSSRNSTRLRINARLCLQCAFDTDNIKRRIVNKILREIHCSCVNFNYTTGNSIVFHTSNNNAMWAQMICVARITTTIPKKLTPSVVSCVVGAASTLAHVHHQKFTSGMKLICFRHWHILTRPTTNQQFDWSNDWKEWAKLVWKVSMKRIQ